MFSAKWVVTFSDYELLSSSYSSFLQFDDGSTWLALTFATPQPLEALGLSSCSPSLHPLAVVLGNAPSASLSFLGCFRGPPVLCCLPSWWTCVDRQGSWLPSEWICDHNWEKWNNLQRWTLDAVMYISWVVLFQSRNSCSWKGAR